MLDSAKRYERTLLLIAELPIDETEKQIRQWLKTAHPLIAGMPVFPTIAKIVSCLESKGMSREEAAVALSKESGAYLDSALTEQLRGVIDEVWEAGAPDFLARVGMHYLHI